ncbi:MAG: ATP-binding cassette domain-containing protein [Bacteroidia bacterium]
MNSISLNNISKKYTGHWLFKNINVQINAGDPMAITGFNGSGKSTLLKIISGYTVPTEGVVNYVINGKTIEQENIFHYISYAAPYLDLIDDFTLMENISFFTQFKKLKENISIRELVHIAFLEGSENKQVKFFSSGMKQRLKLSLAVLADTPILLLDEPLANLDSKGFQWYADLTVKYLQNRICIICSNNTKDETAVCKATLNVEDFK